MIDAREWTVGKIVEDARRRTDGLPPAERGPALAAAAARLAKLSGMFPATDAAKTPSGFMRAVVPEFKRAGEILAQAREQNDGPASTP